MAPTHEGWQRNRPAHHGGAQRVYSQPPTPRYGRTSPPYCEHCAIAKCSASTNRVLASRQQQQLALLPRPRQTSLLLPGFGMDLLDDIDGAEIENKGM